MIQVCCYNNCGVVYGEKEPLSDKKTTHGLCQKHLKIYLKEIKAEIEKVRSRRFWRSSESTEELETDTDVQQRKGGRLP